VAGELLYPGKGANGKLRDEDRSDAYTWDCRYTLGKGRLDSNQLKAHAILPSGGKG
jgi:hypothetical protein